jgi:hypothetical protein
MSYTINKALSLFYRTQRALSKAKHGEYLFELYNCNTTGLFAKEKEKKKTKTVATVAE